MKKRLLSLALTFCVGLSLLSTTALALPQNVTIINIPEAVRGAADRPSEGLMAVASREQYNVVGYMDLKGKLVIPRQFETGGAFHGGVAVVSQKGKYGVIDKTGKFVVPPTYDRADDRFWDGLLAVKKGDKWGMINQYGTVVIPIIYDKIEMSSQYGEGLHFTGGVLYVQLNGKWGGIDKKGNIIIPFQYTELGGTHGNLRFAAKTVTENGKPVIRWGAFDQSGNPAVPFVYDDIGYFVSEGAVSIVKGGKWGFYDLRAGKELVAPIYDEPGNFYEGFQNGFAAICKDKKFGYMNRAGVVVIPPQYDELRGGFQDGIALVAKRPAGVIEGCWGYIDTTGKPITEFTHIGASPFSEGLGCLSNGKDYYSGKYGAVNTKGQLVIPYQFDYLSAFEHGRAFYSPYTGNPNATLQQGYVDKTGKVVVKAQYTRADAYTDLGGGGRDVYALVTYDYLEFGAFMNAKHYTIDPSGKQVKPYGFYSIYPFIDGMAEGRSIYNAQDSIAWIIDNNYKAPVDPTPQRYVTFPCNKSAILINGKPISFEGYTLAGSNYFKLRDLAMALNGTPGQFNVTWDNAKGAVNIIPGAAYEPAGGELVLGDGSAKSVAPSAAKTYIMGQDSGLVPVVVGGNNYYMLRELMEKLGVTVGWDGATNTISLTTKTAEQVSADGVAVTGALEDGVYAIKAQKNRSIGLSVSGDSTEPGGKITLYTTTDEEHYRFTVKSLGGDKYSITALHSGLAVTSPQKKGSGLTQQNANGSAAQTFTITYQGDGTYRIQDCDGLYFAASAGKIENNNPVILWTRTEEAGQGFVFERK